MSSRTLWLGDFYGGAECALIAGNESWCLAGGDRLLLYRRGALFPLDEIRWAHAMREEASGVAHILTDSRSDDTAVWEVAATTAACRRVRPSKKYRNQSNTDTVNW